jgi:hypothetical protein
MTLTSKSLKSTTIAWIKKSSRNKMSGRKLLKIIMRKGRNVSNCK